MSKFKNLDISSFYNSNVKKGIKYSIFENSCQIWWLTKTFKNHKVTSMRHMFEYYSVLTSIDLISFEHKFID